MGDTCPARGGHPAARLLIRAAVLPTSGGLTRRRSPPPCATMWNALRQRIEEKPGLQTLLRTLYYLAILLGLFALYGRGDFSTPAFVYQGF